MKTIEMETVELISKSFSELRSTEGALQLLKHFNSIKSRDAIKNAMQDKLAEILTQFSAEVNHVAALCFGDRWCSCLRTSRTVTNLLILLTRSPSSSARTTPTLPVLKTSLRCAP